MDDADAFSELYRREGEAVLVFLTRRTLDVEVALDLTGRGWTGAASPLRGARFMGGLERIRPTAGAVGAAVTSILDSLPTAQTLVAPAGYSARSRVHVEGVTMDELDAAVIAAGGRIEARQLRPRLLPGRHGPRITDTFWYVIPETALTASHRVR